MEVKNYFFKDNWLEGPHSLEEIEKFIQEKAIDKDIPCWNMTHEKWLSFNELLAEDKGLSAASEVAELKRPPQYDPRAIMLLRVATEKDMITKEQASRVIDELEEGSDTQTVSDNLITKGWITSAQRSLLNKSLTDDAATKTMGGYVVLRELGKGGMGITYLARQISMDRFVALKVLDSKFSQNNEYIRRFEREAKMAARLNHENIATAYDVGLDSGEYFISMEYVQGKTLKMIFTKKKPPSEKQVFNIMNQVCLALNHAFEHNMVHRDISPQNIMMTRKGKIKLIDMGLSKTVLPDNSDLTATGIALGTPAYMSPEQAMGKSQLDIRSDIYSLGCVIFELVTGKTALAGNTPMETLNNHAHKRFPFLKDEKPEASEKLSQILFKMTALNPDERYQNPQEILNDLKSSSIASTMFTASSQNIPSIREQLDKADWKKEVTIRFRLEWREYNSLLLRDLEQQLDNANVTLEFKAFVQTIMTELIANAFDHGCKDNEDGIVIIKCEFNDAFFRVEIEDPGPGFNANEMMEKIKKEPTGRQRRRGMIQLLNIADTLQYSTKGNKVKAVVYRKSEGSGIDEHEEDNIYFVEVRGKGDMALTEDFCRWVDKFHHSQGQRILLSIRCEYVSSMFVGAIVKLQNNLKKYGSAISVWVEHHSCLRIMDQLGLNTFTHIYSTFSEAKYSLFLADVGDSGIVDPPEKNEEDQNSGDNIADETLHESDVVDEDEIREEEKKERTKSRPRISKRVRKVEEPPPPPKGPVKKIVKWMTSWLD